MPTSQRQSRRSWAVVVAVAALMACDCSHAFAPSSIPSRTTRATTPSIHKLHISGVTSQSRRTHSETSLHALPNPTSSITKASAACFAPPIANFALRSISDKGKFGDPTQGQAVYTKAQCAQCHRFDNFG